MKGCRRHYELEGGCDSCKLLEVSDQIDERFAQLHREVIDACTIGPLHELQKRLETVFGKTRLEIMNFFTKGDSDV